MNRRKFNLLGAASVIAAGAKGGRATAATSDQAAQLKTNLTPFGAERAGSADGSIPAWSGGMTEIPAGVIANQGIMPDFFASDAKVASITAGNMAQYQAKLTDGVVQMLQKYPDFRVDVYPTHRTACASQFFYDSTATNAVNAQIVPGLRFGFTNAYGGAPFPILDTDPQTAGAQAMYNHLTRWTGTYLTRTGAYHVVQGGAAPVLTTGAKTAFYYPYLNPNGSYATWSHFTYMSHTYNVAPPVQVGGQNVYYTSLNTLERPTQIWLYLVGQGRTRRAPEVQYDHPQAFNDGLENTDDNFMFTGAIDKYDWTLLGRKEIYVPYNCNRLYACSIAEAFGPHTLNPDAVRWELHRVWVVDAVLHPGERHVVAHRRMYIDEDTWAIILQDQWDANGNFWKTSMGFLENRPDVPGTILGNTVLYNIQANEYTTSTSAWNTAPYNGPYDTATIPEQIFNPNSMAAQEQY